MEWAIVAILDTRQKLLGKFCHLFETPHGTKWLVIAVITEMVTKTFLQT